jgi:hypothetical protein
MPGAALSYDFCGSNDGEVVVADTSAIHGAKPRPSVGFRAAAIARKKLK